MKQTYDIVVIGGGPAGITLAKRLGKKFNILIIRPEEYSMIYCAMPYVIEDLLDIHKCFKKDEVTTESGAHLLRDIVTNVNFNTQEITLANSTAITYKKLVFATGANPFIPPIEGVELNGVLGFKTQKDLEAIHSHIKNGVNKAIVVGAGAIGIELAQALREKGLEVSLVDMGTHILPNLVDKEFAQKASEKLIKNNIKLHLESKVEKLKGDNYVQEVHLSTGEILYLSDTDSCSTHNNTNSKGIVVFATGVVPELSMIPSNTISIGRHGIIVTDKMETNIENVYAVGDCVEYKNLITQKTGPGKLATNAVPMARVLADNLLGKNSSYKDFVNGSATKIYDYFIGGTGLTSQIAEQENFSIRKGYSQVTTQFPIMPETKPLHVTLLTDAQSLKIIGGQVLSGVAVTSIIDLISFAIQKEATIYDIRDLSYSSQPYQSFFPAGNALVNAAEQIISQIE